ncbi:hypothetical protein [Oscillatoria salina]|uniref:hypothetical protein n=1 Tax=Oscillatoria salina TaxID=331517 RepID=UPI0013BD7347|nr:hypothetical protein [Oscillatoria salina]MBZ8179028.1 hypothetical protein [Oscillatoria salina IIICB1]NET88481.1 hypothetical protein [Kamptonema sp. SIO1D9]
MKKISQWAKVIIGEGKDENTSIAVSGAMPEAYRQTKLIFLFTSWQISGIIF